MLPLSPPDPRPQKAEQTWILRQPGILLFLNFVDGLDTSGVGSALVGHILVVDGLLDSHGSPVGQLLVLEN